MEPGSPPSAPVELRAEVPGAVLWLAGCTAFLVVTLLGCSGAFGMAVAGTLGERVRFLERELAAESAAREQIEDADRALHNLAELLESVRVEEREYPVALPELPPEDPWGTPILYRRAGPERAELRSAGPDREFRTADDRVVALPLE